MEDTKQNNYRKWSLFIKWVFGICVVSVALICIYFVLDLTGKIKALEKLVDGSETEYQWIATLLFSSIFVIVVAYILLSLYIFLSHRSVEDPRMHALPILLSPIFLIVENAIVSMWAKGNPIYYQVIMTVFSSTVVGVITFASIKLSFEISSQRSRFIETAKTKPDITITKCKSDKFIAEIKNNYCYLCGVYVGKIEKILYRDIKRTGNVFHMRKMYFPNTKFMYEDKDDNAIDFSCILDRDIKSLCKYADIDVQDIYLIFRDKQNYYYFARLPYKEDSKYKVIGVNEQIVTRLIHKYNKWQYKYNKSERLRLSNQCCNIAYESIECFPIPYNFHADN